MPNTNKQKRYDTILRNYQWLERLWRVEEIGFKETIESLRINWSLPNNEFKPLILENENLSDEELSRETKERISTMGEAVNRKRMEFYRELKRKGKLPQFLKELALILDRYNMGTEWIEPITELALTGFTIPPAYNFRITWCKKYPFIVLNPTTSLRDIKEGRNYIIRVKNWFYQNIKKIPKIEGGFKRIKIRLFKLPLPLNLKVAYWRGFLIIPLRRATFVKDIEKGWHRIERLKKIIYPKTKKSHLKPKQEMYLEIYKRGREWMPTSKENIDIVGTGEEKPLRKSLEKVATIFFDFGNNDPITDERRIALIRQIHRRLKLSSMNRE